MRVLSVPLTLSFLAVSPATASEHWFYVRGEWNPTTSEMEVLRVGIEQQVRLLAQKKHWKLRDWDTYKFQYQAQTVANQRIVIINAFCYLDDSIDLHQELVVVLDGGNCYFTVKFDPTTNVFFDLFVNGEA